MVSVTVTVIGTVTGTVTQLGWPHRCRESRAATLAFRNPMNSSNNSHNSFGLAFRRLAQTIHHISADGRNSS